MVMAQDLVSCQSMAYRNWFRNYMTYKHYDLSTATEWQVQLQTEIQTKMINATEQRE